MPCFHCSWNGMNLSLCPWFYYILKVDSFVYSIYRDKRLIHVHIHTKIYTVFIICVYLLHVCTVCRDMCVSIFIICIIFGGSNRNHLSTKSCRNSFLCLTNHSIINEEKAARKNRLFSGMGFRTLAP